MYTVYRLIIASACCFSLNSHADVEIGLGSGASSAFSSGYGGLLIMPIKPNPYLIIEPYVGYQKRTESTDKTGPNYSIRSSSSRQIGVGLYGIKRLSVYFEFIYGAAFASGRSSLVEDYKNTFNSSVTLQNTTTDTKSYLLKPSLGISYLVTENYSFTLDAGIYFYKGEEVKRRTNPANAVPLDYTVDARQTNFFSQVVFRMFY